jgi:hypothetical protein
MRSKSLSVTQPGHQRGTPLSAPSTNRAVVRGAVATKTPSATISSTRRSPPAGQCVGVARDGLGGVDHQPGQDVFLVADVVVQPGRGEPDCLADLFEDHALVAVGGHRGGCCSQDQVAKRRDTDPPPGAPRAPCRPPGRFACGRPGWPSPTAPSRRANGSGQRRAITPHMRSTLPSAARPGAVPTAGTVVDSVWSPCSNDR